MLRLDEDRNNALLASLSDAAWQRWQPHLHLVELQRGQTLSHAGCKLEHVHFPIQAVVAMYAITDNGTCSELSLVGHEGMVGVCGLMDSKAIFNNVMVVVGGPCWRMSTAYFRAEVMGESPLLQMMLRYMQSMITQVAQTAVCNRHHSIDQALCRWLLMSQDRVRGTPLQLTHELIGRLMRVRREGVTEAAVRLQRSGLIQYTRGCITVTDRGGLERAACECYGRIRTEHQRLLGWPDTWPAHSLI
jgi:CRP-like cAMP-binding protein